MPFSAEDWAAIALTLRLAATTTVLLPMSRGDIADYLGLTVETVSRSFTKLRRQNLIALPDVNRVKILDLPGLEALVGG
jgi:CRP/FNR family transcriptional regulator